MVLSTFPEYGTTLISLSLFRNTILQTNVEGLKLPRQN
jgi:hypothetical protein